MTHHAVVEVWPSEAILYVPALPGLQVNAPTPEEAARLAPVRLLAFMEWLADLELVGPTVEGYEVEVTETLRADAGHGPLFTTDQTDPDEAHVELALAVGRGEVSDIVELVTDLSDEGMADAARTLTHLAEMDRWYAGRLQVDTPTPLPVSDPVETLIATASAFEEAVDRRVELGPASDWEIDGERWTLAKVLRRRTGHLREHLPSLIAIDQD